ncbi:hypothetical protein PVAG01_01551 [Phlyctema vagabunda]|uniref:DNA replication regulator Sld3 C-terminal domain-containing protein n=1 Tax=Phlyctema vagabunda TaxID=108571 RepID=A0ABR4PXG5_9HELO
MFRRDGHLLSDASANTRQGTALAAASGTPIPAFTGEKRKRDGSALEDTLNQSFVIKPHPSSVFDKPRTLQPLVLLPRSQLSLSCLDLFPSSTPLPQSRLFEAHVKILELEERMGTQPTTLIARLDTSKVLYAVERESRGLYVLCQLGPWVDIHNLGVVRTPSNLEGIKTTFRSPLPTDISREPTPATEITTESAKYSKKKRLAIEAIQSMVKRPSVDVLGTLRQSTSNPGSSLDSQNNSQFSATTGDGVGSQVDSQPIGEAQIEESAVSPPTAAEICDNVRHQYLDTLYLSKASLAYFAKGPLSRARAAFHLDFDSNLNMNEYIGFLEGLILSTNLVDKKYRDGVPNCLSLLDMHENTADDGEQTNGKPKKKRLSKKMKPGKTGLYPTEDFLIRKWWESYDIEVDSGAPGSSREEVMKSRISQLRIRETQLQMIVILEVLALQPLVAPQDVMDVDLPMLLPGPAKDEKERPAKTKKREHLLVLIDVHIDRLCIWQSVAADTKVEGDLVKRDRSEPRIASKHSSDVLRDFCVDVIAPFFSARLPDHCVSINRKLGGPVAVTPGRPGLSRSASSSHGQRPGAATKRPLPSKAQRSLKRVLSDDRERRSVSRGPARAISLMRSASIPVLKREMSEPVSLSNIPSVDAQTSQGNRTSLFNSKRFSQREVDLSALTDVNTKAKKQANIETELKNAISALKKPNRELAGKSLAEVAEQRVATASRSARKTKKPVRNPLFQGVQISATPKATRQKDVFNNAPSSVSFDSPDLGCILASNITRVPQSSLPTHDSNYPYSTIQATPTRRSYSSNQKEQRMCPPSSPLHVRRSSVQLFANNHTSSVDETTLAVQDTPVKKRLWEHAHPNSEKENSESDGKPRLVIDSIYKSLGWDDDLDDLK